MNIDRLMDNLMTLGHIGYEEGKGTSRPAYSKSFTEGLKYVRKLMEEAGLITSVDGVGNLTGLMPGKDKGAKKLAVGSHIDTVPCGGMYDGALGVLAGIEAVRSLKEQGYENLHPIELIAFNEEEGNVVGGTFGSKAFAGLPPEEAMIDKMAAQNLSLEDYKNAKRRGEDYLAYLEYHIEQGGILDSCGTDIGIVPGIFGIVRFRVSIKGEANHAGSTPMYLRKDAMEKACRFITRAMDGARSTSETMVCTVGVMKLEPGAVNVIPGRAEFVLELRDRKMEPMDRLAEALREEFAEDAEMIQIIRQDNTDCSPELSRVFRECAGDLGYSWKEVYSGAGHDLINTRFMMPAALLFIPSVKGISHHRDEYSKKEDIEKGTKVLIEAIKRIDGGKIGEN